MKPKKFKEVNITYSEDQPEYISLPGFKSDTPEGKFVFCMELSFKERIRILFTGELWCGLLTFHKKLTPSFFTTKKSELIKSN